jgi:hypothetical protein
MADSLPQGIFGVREATNDEQARNPLSLPGKTGHYGLPPK